MTDYAVKQIQPNHADHISYYKDKYLQDMFENEPVIAQPKYDGERMLIHFDGNHVYCTSRRISKLTGKFTENQDKLPFLCKKYESSVHFEYTVLDCECYSKDWSTIVGILHSLPERAFELQAVNSPCFAVFDCLFYNGYDMRDKTYKERLRAASIVVSNINYAPLHMVKFMNATHDVDDISSVALIRSTVDWQECMEHAINSGFEGVVIKSLMKTYYDKGASLKCKKFETVDCVAVGYQLGRGKYENTIGALEIGYYEPDTNSFVKISNVNCGTDEERDMWYNNWSVMKHKVIEVKCQEITERSLRHPVYIRLRDDKDYTMCTKNTIFKEEEQ